MSRMNVYFYTVTHAGTKYRASVPVYSRKEAAQLLRVDVSQLTFGADSKLPIWNPAIMDESKPETK